VSCQGSSTDQPLHTWPVYQCLYAEIDDADKTYLLAGGKWYAIAAEFVAEVDASVRALIATTVDLPEYDDVDEPAYNTRVAAENPGYALMDRQNIRYGAAGSSIEFCDLFSNKMQLIHVKRGSSSKLLSHLFSQGAVSAELFAMEEGFRDLCRARLPPSHRRFVPLARPAYETCEVVFAIITGTSKPLAEALPFFSRINLRSRAQRLRALGYRISLTKIPIHASRAVSTTRRRIRARPPAARIPTLAGVPTHPPQPRIPGNGSPQGRPASRRKRHPAQR
jgi:uncharacterized protein (TIGR04141 family)